MGEDGQRKAHCEAVSCLYAARAKVSEPLGKSASVVLVGILTRTRTHTHMPTRAHTHTHTFLLSPSFPATWTGLAKESMRFASHSIRWLTLET